MALTNRRGPAFCSVCFKGILIMLPSLIIYSSLLLQSGESVTTLVTNFILPLQLPFSFIKVRQKEVSFKMWCFI